MNRRWIITALSVTAFIFSGLFAYAASPVTKNGTIGGVSIQAKFEAYSSTNPSLWISAFQGTASSSINRIGHTFGVARIECRLSNGTSDGYVYADPYPADGTDGAVTSYGRFKLVPRQSCPKAGYIPFWQTAARLEYKKTGYTTVYLEGVAEN